MSGYLVDTSIFVAAEQQRSLAEPPPGEGRVSVATVTELIVGARRAAGTELQALREATLAEARTYIALSYDELVAERVGELIATARGAGVRVGPMDAIIAATALVHDLTVWTRDDDFEALARLAPELRVRRA